MSKDKKVQVLEVIKKELLPKGRKGRHATAAYQVEDGTIFYRVRYPPDKLLVVRGEEKIVAQLPDDCIYNCGAHGNALYFETANHKICKASFTPTDGITVTHLRNALESPFVFHHITKCSSPADLVLVMRKAQLESLCLEVKHLHIIQILQNEEFLPGGLCTRNEDGTLYVYRMSDDPDVDAIYVDTSSDDLYGASLVGVERRKCYPINVVVFEIRDDSLNKPSARRLIDSVILLEVPPSFSPSFIRDSFVYLGNVEKLLTLNTDTMEFLPSVQIGDSATIINIVGVHKDEITVTVKEGEDSYLISVRLLDGYF
ncbi:hypothetical protein PRIPAC_88283 [Pristionchus pacificus]|uniref:Uncharacterized protein n=1 Tax=Pristionchus pacificus TaxID=54126 RepID=A0A2A6CXC9_PRIPA|nr:hypothetical protein PRIPAC_88283 [Pristionchus pacificus]|eukprot:PDM82707.1 hypothetical protein PRIPAC_37100 [Pristionchus pacificus]